MSNPFVWMDNRASKDSSAAAAFYSDVFGWTTSDGPGMTMFAAEAPPPFAGVFDAPSDIIGWVPYVQVADLGEAEKRTVDAGGEIAQARTKGPAGEFTLVRDPGGSPIALWTP
jgi:predicted enzyme related to lactoylglutathione lyase